jgi:hypothetical protein
MSRHGNATPAIGEPRGEVSEMSRVFFVCCHKEEWCWPTPLEDGARNLKVHVATLEHVHQVFEEI